MLWCVREREREKEREREGRCMMVHRLENVLILSSIGLGSKRNNASASHQWTGFDHLPWLCGIFSHASTTFLLLS